MEKNNQITAVLYGLIAVLEINEKDLGWFFAIMAFDMFFGAIKSVVVPTLSFDTKVFFFGFLRKLTLLALVLFVATLAKGLGYNDMTGITTKIIQTLMITESISVLHCIKSILSFKESKSKDFITMLIEGFIRYLGNKIEKLAKVLNENNSCL